MLSLRLSPSRPYIEKCLVRFGVERPKVHTMSGSLPTIFESLQLFPPYCGEVPFERCPRLSRFGRYFLGYFCEVSKYAWKVVAAKCVSGGFPDSVETVCMECDVNDTVCAWWPKERWGSVVRNHQA